MMNKFDELKQGLLPDGKRVISVAAAGDPEVIEAVLKIHSEGIAEAVLVGDKPVIQELSKKAGLPKDIKILDAEDDISAARIAAQLVRDGEANVLMKGLVNTSDFLRAVLDKEHGIRGEGLLSNMAVFEVPAYPKLIFQTDGGMNLYPTLEEKVKILYNAVEAMHALGIELPKVAALTANEQVNPKLSSSVDAKELADMNKAGEISGCIVEGPIAFDVAVSSEAAKHKGIDSKIAGDTDLFLVPNIDAGNIMGKTLMYMAKAKMAGVILGAKAPIILASRADTSEGKYYSALLACAIADRSQVV